MRRTFSIVGGVVVLGVVGLMLVLFLVGTGVAQEGTTTTTIPPSTTSPTTEPVTTTTTIPDETTTFPATTTTTLVPEPDLVHGCIGKNGLIRVVSDVATCRGAETPISFLAWIGGLDG